MFVSKSSSHAQDTITVKVTEIKNHWCEKKAFQKVDIWKKLINKSSKTNKEKQTPYILKIDIKRNITMLT